GGQVAGGQLAEVGAVGGDPDGARRVQGDAPGVLESRVGERGDAGLVGRQVGGQVRGAGTTRGAPVFQEFHARSCGRGGGGSHGRPRGIGGDKRVPGGTEDRPGRGR